MQDLTQRTTWEFDDERFILCEGEHDEYVLDSLIRERGLPSFQIRHAAECSKALTGGRDAFGPAIQGFPAITGFDRLKGIAIVTDNDNKGALSKTEKILKRHGYKSEGSGCIGMIHEKPVVIILIPDDKTFGNLETLCLPALYSKWPDAEECVKAYLECTGAFEWKKQHKLDKAKVRSIISGFNEKDPNKSLGYLFKQEKLLVKHPCFNGLADILKRFDEIVENRALE